jgi:hypothetical protein
MSLTRQPSSRYRATKAVPELDRQVAKALDNASAAIARIVQRRGTYSSLPKRYRDRIIQACLLITKNRASEQEKQLFVMEAEIYRFLRSGNDRNPNRDKHG